MINGWVVARRAGCGGGGEKYQAANAGCPKTIEEKMSSACVGDCLGGFGETKKIATVDRDEWGSIGLDTEAMDRRFDAGDDFFCHVNGLWYANFEMPEDKTRSGSFTLLRDKSEARVQTIIGLSLIHL